MTDRTLAQLQIAEEAKALEAAGADWSIRHVAAVLGCAKSTVYDTHWLIAISHRVGKGGVRWTPARVRAAQLKESASRDRRTFKRSRRKTA